MAQQTKKSDTAMQFDVKAGSDVPLGLSLNQGRFQFAASFPQKKECSLLLYKKGEQEPIAEILMPRLNSGIFSVSVALPRKGSAAKPEMEYLYRTEDTLHCDPYATKIVGREKFGAEPEMVRAGVVVPEEGKNRTSYQRHFFDDLILYKIHVRGFTLGRESKVKRKGTFAGLAEKIPYLKELGVTGVLLMPVTEFDELEETHQTQSSKLFGMPKRKYAGQTTSSQSDANTEKKQGRINFWGYASTGTFYFAPKAAYAAKPEKASEEFQTLVEQFHEAGIDVYLEMMFDGHCSQSFMLECLRYWTRMYQVDGFHINDALLSMELLAGDPYLQQTVFFATNVPNQLKELYPNRLIEYQDSFAYDMRRYLKGDEGMVPALYDGFVHHDDGVGKLHYITDHNGFTLRDLYSYDIRHNEANGEGGRDGTEYNFSWNCGEEGSSKKVKTEAMRQKMMKNALTVLLLSGGIPMLLGGDEFGHTKQGNNNSFCQDNEISWLDWSRLRKQTELFEYCKTLIEVRKQHPIFTLSREMKQTDFISCGWPEISLHGVLPWNVDASAYNRLAGILLCGSYVRRQDKTFDDSFYLIFNMHWEQHTFELPEFADTDWDILMKTGETKIEKSSKDIVLEPRSIVILQSRKKPKLLVEANTGKKVRKKQEDKL